MSKDTDLKALPLVLEGGMHATRAIRCTLWSPGALVTQTLWT